MFRTADVASARVGADAPRASLLKQKNTAIDIDKCHNKSILIWALCLVQPSVIDGTRVIRLCTRVCTSIIARLRELIPATCIYK